MMIFEIDPRPNIMMISGKSAISGAWHRSLKAADRRPLWTPLYQPIGTPITTPRTMEIAKPIEKFVRLNHICSQMEPLAKSS